MTQSDKKIVQKVIDGTSSKENAQYVAHWFSSSIEGQQTLSDMMDRDAYMMEEELLEENQITPIQSDFIFSRIQNKIRIQQIKHTSWLAAAVLLPFIFLIGLGTYVNMHTNIFSKTTYTEVHIPKGEKARILFQDGTEVFLNSESTIRYPNKFGFSKRTVSLQGEAYFNVAHNRYRPFIVETGDTKVKVLGTSFNVNAYDNNDKMSVTLDEGKVIFNSPQIQYQLSPGQHVVYDKRNGNYTVEKLSQSENNSLWMSNILYLHDTPLDEVLKILERRFDITFSIKNNLSLDYSYTITTEESDLDTILLELERIAPVKFDVKNGVCEVL